MTIPLDGPFAYGGWWVRIGYLASGRQPGPRQRRRTSPSTRACQPGVHALYFQAGDDFDSIRLGGLIGEATLCTDDVTVGRADQWQPEPS